MSRMYLRPDWAIIGVPSTDGRVSVVGSTELTEAEMRAEIQYADLPDFRITATESPITSRYFLTATLRTFVYAEGDTYAEALANLFAFWDADETRKRSPLGAQPQLAP